MSTTADLMGLGMPPALAARLGATVATLVGAGTAQVGATLISAPLVLAGPTTGNTAFVLNAAFSVGRAIYVWNTSSSLAALVYPPTGGTINGGAANASVSILPLTGAILQLQSGSGGASTAWGFLPGTAANGAASTQYTAVSTNTPATLTGAQMAGSNDVAINMTAALAGAGTLNSATAAQIVAAIPGVQPGFSYNLRIINSSSGNFAWTLTTATGITLSGTMTMAQNTFRDFYVTVTSLTAVAIQSVGTGTFS